MIRGAYIDRGVPEGRRLLGWCPMNRGQFERLLVLRLDKVRVGTAQRAKRLIGGAWRTTIDDMYEWHAEQLSNEFAPVTECADAIVRLMKSMKD